MLCDRCQFTYDAVETWQNWNNRSNTEESGTVERLSCSKLEQGCSTRTVHDGHVSHLMVDDQALHITRALDAMNHGMVKEPQEGTRAELSCPLSAIIGKSVECSCHN